ncbi:MAG: hypothetical protein JXX28_16530 [Deltaproteobacteria bacterium]|nr:hypothetical protein [Deltaproteobacteria bacterium]
MRPVCLISLALAMASCSKEEPGDTAAMDVEFEASGPGAGLACDAPAGTAEALDAQSAVEGAMSVVLSDEELQRDFLEVSDGGRRALDDSCYTRTRVGVGELLFDLAGCADQGMSGTVTVERQLAGPLLVHFNDDFAVKTYDVDGTVALDRVSGEGASWTVFSADAEGTAGEAPLRLTGPDGPTELEVQGVVKVDAVGSEVKLWGSFAATTGGTTSTFYAGGTDQDVVTQASPPVEAVLYGISPVTCLCPQGGLVAGEVSFSMTEVTIDLDAYKKRNQDEDLIPELTVPVEVALSGAVEVRFTGCGTYELVFNPEEGAEPAVVLSLEAVSGALDAACEDGTMPEEACTLARGAVSYLSGVGTSELTVSYDASAVEGAAAQAVAAAWDTAFCQL